jgi:hypothetical protein
LPVNAVELPWIIIACGCSGIFRGTEHHLGFTVMPGRLLQAVAIVRVVLGGSLIGRARMERHVEGLVLHDKILDLPLTRRDRLQYF